MPTIFCHGERTAPPCNAAVHDSQEEDERDFEPSDMAAPSIFYVLRIVK